MERVANDVNLSLEGRIIVAVVQTTGMLNVAEGSEPRWKLDGSYCYKYLNVLKSGLQRQAKRPADMATGMDGGTGSQPIGTN